jgi:hypothetical protein
MSAAGKVWPVLAALTLALIMLGCGNGTQTLTALSITPASVTANGSPVTFTADAKLSDGSHTHSWPVQWSNYNPISLPPTPVPGGFTIDQNGVATCTPGIAANTWTVYASAPDRLSVTGSTAVKLVMTTAELTCP